MVPALLAITTEPWAQERALLVLTLRFGRVHGADWRAWSAWLRAQFVLAGVMGTFAAVGLGLMGVPYFYVIALVAAPLSPLSMQNHPPSCPSTMPGTVGR